MRIVIIGDKQYQTELMQKFGPDHQYALIENHPISEADLLSAELIFDFTIEESPENLDSYTDVEESLIFVNSIKTGLAELRYAMGDVANKLIGFNGLPTFINRSILEISTLNPSNKEKAEEFLKKAATEFLWVDDRVGMASARVVCMIINEAYYTVQEGTASKEDIDQGMKLGTNYPHGPFEWCNKIGVKHVYELLEALYEDTKEERYKICPLLKKEFLLLG